MVKSRVAYRTEPSVASKGRFGSLPFGTLGSRYQARPAASAFQCELHFARTRSHSSLRPPQISGNSGDALASGRHRTQRSDVLIIPRLAFS
jgi:hypothetical protein